MQAVRKWALELKEEREQDVQVRLVEPPLVDTPLARREFADVVKDWSMITKVDAVVAEALEGL
jgi:short-subunit dehydrogenase